MGILLKITQTCTTIIASTPAVLTETGFFSWYKKVQCWEKSYICLLVMLIGANEDYW